MSKTAGKSYKKIQIPIGSPNKGLSVCPTRGNKEGKLQRFIGIYTCWAFGLTSDRSCILWPSFLLPHQDSTRQGCLSSVLLQIKILSPCKTDLSQLSVLFQVPPFFELQLVLRVSVNRHLNQ